MLNASSRGKCLVFGHCLMCECASTICFVHVALYRAYQHVGVSLSECDYIILYYIILKTYSSYTSRTLSESRNELLSSHLRAEGPQ